MRDCNVRSTDEALAYLTNCTLATVSSLAMKKSRSESEYKRQISIAQKACDWMHCFDVFDAGNRAHEIIGICTVQEWADKWDVKKK